MVLLSILWICWCTLHSLLIIDRINDWIREKGGMLQGAYRLAYAFFSFIPLALLVWYQYTLPQQVVFSWSGWLRIPQGLLLFYAVIMVYGGMKVYDFSYLVGIRQWKNYRRGLQTPELPFTCQGALSYVRHPWYSSGLAILWTVGLITDITLPARIILTLYLLVGTVLEEQKLLRHLGAAYRSYCKQVPMLIPWRGKIKIIPINNGNSH